MVVTLLQFLRSKWASLACLVVVAVSLLLPAQGFSLPGGKPLPACQFKMVTHLPCLGCGLTRSYVGMAHLDVRRAARFHPLGLVLFPITAFFAALLPVPRERRERMAAWVEARRATFSLALWTLAGFFVLYGFGRIVWLLVSPQANIW